MAKPTRLKKSRILNSRGMTLIEILIVLAIIGTLMAVLLPQVQERLNRSKVGETKIIMGKVIDALNMYYTDCGKYPESLEGLVTQDQSCSNWGPEPYVKKLPKDAWNTDFVYTMEGNSFVLKSYGADKREGGSGNNKDISSEDIQ